MRIAFIIANLPQRRIGGAQVQAWELAKRLSEGHDVTIFTRSFPDAGRAEGESGIRLVLSRPWPRLLFWPLSYFLHLHGTVSNICRHMSEFDMLLCYMTTPGGVIGRMVKHRTGLPFLTWIRGSDWYLFVKKGWGRRMLRSVVMASDRVLVQTQAIKDDVRAFDASVNPVVIPNGVEMEKGFAAGDAFMFVGNLLRRKGVDVFIDALGNVPCARAIVVGDGPERSRLESRSRGRDVMFMGKQRYSDIRALMKEKGRALVLPSTEHEGMPNVLLEAMAVGLPVIATRVAGGVMDLVNDGKNGILVPPKDANSLSRAMQAILDDPSRCRNLAEEGRKTASSYTWDNIVPRMEAVLSSIRTSWQQRR